MECVQNLRVNDAQQSNSALWLVLSGSMLNSDHRWIQVGFCENGPRVVDGPMVVGSSRWHWIIHFGEHGAVT